LPRAGPREASVTRQLVVRGSSWPTWASRGSSASSSRPASVRL